MGEEQPIAEHPTSRSKATLDLPWDTTISSTSRQLSGCSPDCVPLTATFQPLLPDYPLSSPHFPLPHHLPWVLSCMDKCLRTHCFWT